MRSGNTHPPVCNATPTENAFVRFPYELRYTFAGSTRQWTMHFHCERARERFRGSIKMFATFEPEQLTLLEG